MKKLLLIATGGTIACRETENGLSPALGGAELLGRRGTDDRLEDHHRPTREQKREEQRARTAARMDRLAAMEAERRAGHWADPSADGDGPR